MGKNLTFTLAFNLVSEVAESIERLYQQNANFHHLIVDCGFPLTADELPDDIEKAKKQNTGALIALSYKYNCDYLKIKNEGVSQNWNQIFEYLNPDDDDIILCADADEQPVENGWVQAICDVLRSSPDIGYCASLLTDAKPILDDKIPVVTVGGHRVYDMGYASINYGLVGIKASFIRKTGGVPVPGDMNIYGGLEAMLLQNLRQQKMKWHILCDFTHVHTNNCKLYRQWKDQIIFSEALEGKPQTTFEKWLMSKVEA